MKPLFDKFTQIDLSWFQNDTRWEGVAHEPGERVWHINEVGGVRYKLS